MALMLEADKRGLLPPEKKAILAEAIKRGLVQDQQDMTTPEKPTALERLGRGMSDVTEGLKQGALMVKDAFTGGNEADAYTRAKTDDIALYEKGRRNGATTLSDLVTGRPGDPGIDWWRIGGNIAGTLPAMAIPGGGAAGLGTRIASGAAQGAAASGSMFTPEGESKAGQVTIGALVGGAVPAVLEGGRRVVGSLMDKVRPSPVIDISPQGSLAGEIKLRLEQQGLDWNKVTQNVRQSLLNDAKATLEAGGTLDDAMLRNKALIESVGAKPTKASVTRNPRDWQTEKNLRGIQGVGDDIVQRDTENAKALTEYLAKLRAQTGGRSVTALEAGEGAIKTVQAQDQAKKAAVTKLYDAFRSAGMQDAEVPATRIADTLGKVADEIGAENIPGPVMSRLKEFGLMGGQQTKLLTVNEADKLGRLINNNNPGRGTPGAKALQPIKDAIDEALLDVSPNAKQGVDALMEARAAHAARMTEQKAGKGITAAIEDVSPDRFVKKFVFDADVRDLKALKAELLKTPEGVQAVKDIKGHLLDNLLMKSTGATSVDDVLGKPFSGVRFGKALDAISPEKLHTLFTPDEIGALRNLQKASKLLTEEVSFSDVNHSKTTAALANLLQKIGNTPLLGQIVSPIIGAGKMGMDWVNDANARKQVAEALIGSAGKAAETTARQLPRFGMEPALPAVAAGALANPGERSNQ